MVEDRVGAGLDDAVFRFGAGHQRRASGNVGHARVKLLHLIVLRRADQKQPGGVPLHDIWREAARVDDGIVDACVVYHVLAQEIHAHVHQLQPVQRAPAQLRLLGRV